MVIGVRLLQYAFPVIFFMQVEITAVLSFTQYKRCSSSFRETALSASKCNAPNDPSWPFRALLFSSLSDGILDNKEALAFFRSSLFCSMINREVNLLESKVEKSALFSPCNGPDPTLVASLEDIDDTASKLQSNCTSIDEKNILEKIKTPNIKVLYIPTAMYALRADSNNSPGKQRQRARADAKQRRSQIITILQSLVGDNMSLSSVILDLDDGSIKQSLGSESFQPFPKNGVEAFQEWKPHLIYVEGGNTFWLQHCIEKGEWKPLLLDSIRGENAAVYMGKSAGAIVAGASIDTATWKKWDDPSVVPGKEKYEDWSIVPGLNITGGSSVFPHMNDEWEELVCGKKKSHDNPVYTISDSEVLLVDGSKKSLSIVSKS